MAEKKNSEGLKFLLRLDQAATDKEKLLRLAHDVIDESHDGRTFVQRRSQDLRVNPTSIYVGATIGMGHAMANANISTNDKLYMVMNKYINLAVAGNQKASKDRALAKFCKEFAEKYPQEFGAENAGNRAAATQTNTSFIAGRQGRGMV